MTLDLHSLVCMVTGDFNYKDVKITAAHGM